ncbi:MAG: hypothetical protein GY820_26925, partial [Gammaproteobacteria bacterium]|nr:hypothetical protein [Gammaproteobacteria bacterium]
NCTTDSGHYRHRHCLTTESKAVNRCLSCVAVTQIAKSPDPVRLDRLLQGVCSGLEEECDSDNDSLNSQRVTPSSRQSSVESDAGEDTVVYRAKGDEIWQVSGAKSTLLGETSEITTAMDATAMQQMLDALFQKQEVSRKADLQNLQTDRQADLQRQEDNWQKLEENSQKQEENRQADLQRLEDNRIADQEKFSEALLLIEQRQDAVENLLRNGGDEQNNSLHNASV